jgi:hypothetical protein
MTLEGPCISCTNPTDTGFFLFDGTPDLVAAALMVVGVPRDYAEQNASDQPGDMRVLLCGDCGEKGGRFFLPSTAFPTYNLNKL